MRTLVTLGLGALAMYLLRPKAPGTWAGRPAPQASAKQARACDAGVPVVAPQQAHDQGSAQLHAAILERASLNPP
jgi:hypothetical protein